MRGVLKIGIALTLAASLSACSAASELAVKAITGGSPGVEANIQAGAHNRQATVAVETTKTVTAGGDARQEAPAMVRNETTAGPVETIKQEAPALIRQDAAPTAENVGRDVVVNNAPSLVFMLLLILGWLLPTPNQMWLVMTRSKERPP